MIIVLKAALLMLTALIITPIVFFLLIGFLGNYFYLKIDRNSWLVKTKIKWIKKLGNIFLRY